MLVNILGGLYGPVVISAFSGAMLFTVSQHAFQGKNKVITFVISFLMGNIGAQTTANLVKTYLPGHPDISKELGAFICSALIVTVSIVVISRADSYLRLKKINTSNKQ